MPRPLRNPSCATECCFPVPVDVTAKIPRSSLVNHFCDRGKICGNVVFESSFADVVKEVLRTRDFDDARAAKGFKGIVSESSAAGVTADSAVHVVGRKPSETHGAGLDAPRAGAKGIFLAYRARDDLLKIHLHISEEMFR